MIRSRGFAVSLILYAVAAIAVVGFLTGVALSIRKIGYNAAERHYKPLLETAEKQRDDAKATAEHNAGVAKECGKRTLELQAEGAARAAEAAKARRLAQETARAHAAVLAALDARSAAPTPAGATCQTAWQEIAKAEGG